METKIAVIDFVTNTTFPLLAAEELGFFKAEGLDAHLELIVPAPKAIAALREGTTDGYAAGSVHAVLKSFPSWKGVKIITALSQGIPWLLVVRSSLAASEMRRVTRPGGVVATAMWDTTGGNQLNDALTEAATVIDPEAKLLGGAYGTAEELLSLWNSAGLTDINVKSIVSPCRFDFFDDFWRPLTEGQGPAGTYLRRISEVHQTAVRERLRQDIFGDRVDGPFTLQAKVWAVKGIVP